MGYVVLQTTAIASYVVLISDYFCITIEIKLATDQVCSYMLQTGA